MESFCLSHLPAFLPEYLNHSFLVFFYLHQWHETLRSFPNQAGKQNWSGFSYPAWNQPRMVFAFFFSWGTDSKLKLQSLVKAAIPQFFIFHKFHETQQMPLHFIKQLPPDAQSTTELPPLITTGCYQKEKPQWQLCLPNPSPTSCSQIKLKKT